MNIPKGYTREPPKGQRALIPGQSPYSGADISELRDAKGRKVVAFCCRPIGGAPETFGFRLFWEDTGEEIAYTTPDTPFCHQRGQLWKDDLTGRLMWVAWDGEEYHDGEIAGAAPFPPPLTLQQVIAGIVDRLMKLPDAPITKAVAQTALGALEGRLQAAAAALRGE